MADAKHTINTVFCPTPIHASKQKQKQKRRKQCKIMNFKAKKGKSKYNMVES